jgi:hypothetical protein
MKYALIKTSDNSIDRFSQNVDPGVQTKAGFVWLPCIGTEIPTYNPKTETVDGPSYTVGASSVTEVWTKRLLTAQEISDAKDQEIFNLNNKIYNPLKEILLVVVNDSRATRAKLNALIDATKQSTVVPKYPVNQTTQIDAAQLATAIKKLLT